MELQCPTHIFEYTELVMPSWIDGALYPGCEPPTELATLADRVDFLARLCAAASFGLLPVEATIAEVRKPTWRAAS